MIPRTGLNSSPLLVENLLTHSSHIRSRFPFPTKGIVTSDL